MSTEINTTFTPESYRNLPPHMMGYEVLLNELQSAGNLRTIPQSLNPGTLDCCSNDYMGMRKLAKIPDSCFHNDITSSASRLLCANQDPYNELESLLESLYSKKTILFNSGYHLNTGVIPALCKGAKTIILADKLVHASIIDGIKLSGAEFSRFRHNDIASLEKLLDKHKNAERILVITESIFSMDGDCAPLRQIVGLKSKYTNFLLYIDEAHAFGARGEKGLGLTEELDIIQQTDIIAGTFGKAAASIGAFVAASPLLIEVIKNTARSFIFSTALPPLDVKIALSNINELLQQAHTRVHLSQLSHRLRDGLEKMTGQKNPSQSHIVPLIVGSAKEAVDLSNRLKQRGIQALAIRKPTVPAGTERLRFSVTADMNDSDIDRLLDAISSELK